MISVNIAALKAKLSFYLSRVRQGHEVLVLDRNTPVARMVPSGGARGLVLTQAKRSPRSLLKMSFRPARSATNVVELLREERERR